MHTPEIDHVSAGFVFVYDVHTGDVAWTHEKVVEVVRGREERPTRITEAEAEQIRAEAARVFRGRELRALIAPEGFALRENVRVAVDPAGRFLREIPEEAGDLAERFSDNGQ